MNRLFMAPSNDNAEMSPVEPVKAFIPSTIPATSSSSSSSELQDTKERFLENRCFFDESSVVSPISTRTTRPRSSKKKIRKEKERKNTRIADDQLMAALADFEPKHQHHQYTWEELSKYFGVSLKEAATMLKIHPTQLQRIYSTLGIEKWPYNGVKKVTEIRKREQISEIYSMEEMKFGNTVIEEAIEFGLRNTAKRVPVSVKLAEFKGAKCRQKVVIPPMTAMVMYCIVLLIP